REARLIPAPITEGAAEPVRRRGGDAHLAQPSPESIAAERPLAPWEDKGGCPDRLQPFENPQRPARQRHSMVAPCIHAIGWDCPHLPREINLAPRCAKH